MERVGQPRHRWSNPRGSGRAAGKAASQSAYWLELLEESGVVSVEKLAPLRQEWSSGDACDIDGQPERASVRENASQCEELTAIFVTILKRAKTS